MPLFSHLHIWYIHRYDMSSISAKNKSMLKWADSLFSASLYNCLNAFTSSAASPIKWRMKAYSNVQTKCENCRHGNSARSIFSLFTHNFFSLALTYFTTCCCHTHTHLHVHTTTPSPQKPICLVRRTEKKSVKSTEKPWKNNSNSIQKLRVIAE